MYNKGRVSGILAAYWTKKREGEVKFDMPKTEASGYVTLNDFLGSSGFTGSGNYSTIDVTSEVVTTFQMYQNLYGNKILDFNEDASPFRSLNNILAGNGKQTLGNSLLNKTKGYRLCLITLIQEGERHLTEIRYNQSSGMIELDKDNRPTDSKQL